jgi:hypothetical protein
MRNGVSMYSGRRVSRQLGHRGDAPLHRIRFDAGRFSRGHSRGQLLGVQ